LALAPGTPVIGLVGHLIEQKRPERALEVLTRVRASGVDAHLVVAGTGPLEPEFVADARRRTLTDAVHLLGNRDDVETVLGALDLLLLTSDAEGIPGIVIEAQMTGCPVVTFPVGAVGAVVEDGETGVVVARSDTHLMADAVVKLLQEPELRHALGAEGRRRAGQFSTGRAAREYATRLEALRHARV
ncbi:MAG: glycosyltransferase, partial [Acidimicrobiia bacterium]